MDGRTVTIGGKRWKLRYVTMRSYDGQCDPPTTPRKEIRIAKRLRRYPSALLETILHECLHAGDFDKSEEWVERTSCDIARILIGEGFGFGLDRRTA